MSKKSCFRKPFDSQHAKGSQRLLKCARQHFYHICSLLWEKKSLKICLIVLFQILGKCVNKLTAYGKYSDRNTENSRQKIQKQFSKRKTFSEFFSRVLKCTSKFEHFNTKDNSHSLCISEIRDWERLEKCVKSPFSKHSSTVNVLKATKDFWNLRDSTSIIFYHRFVGNVVGQSLSYWYLKP